MSVYLHASGDYIANFDPNILKLPQTDRFLLFLEHIGFWLVPSPVIPKELKLDLIFHDSPQNLPGEEENQAGQEESKTELATLREEVTILTQTVQQQQKLLEQILKEFTNSKSILVEEHDDNNRSKPDSDRLSITLQSQKRRKLQVSSNLEPVLSFSSLVEEGSTSSPLGSSSVRSPGASSSLSTKQCSKYGCNNYTAFQKTNPQKAKAQCEECLLNHRQNLKKKGK